MENKSWKNKITFFTFAIGFSIISASNVFAANLNISRPTDNERVSGVYEINWSVFDSGQTQIPYEIRLKNSSCSDAGVSIVSNNFAQSVPNGQYTHTWNSNTTVDGRYCLQVCVKFQNSTTQCQQRVFDIVNTTNNPPIITSSPPNLNLDTNDLFTYNISAYDPDGDFILYQLLQGPDFLYLDQNGKMGLGNYMREGVYDIKFAVIDINGSSAEQSFVLQVDLAPTPTATVTTNPKPTSTVVPTSTPEVFENPALRIISPEMDTAFSGLQNKISWEYENIKPSDIGSVIIEYTDTQNVEYKEIFIQENGNIKEYKWDVTDIENGEYVVRMQIFDNEDNFIIEAFSPTFVIGNRESQETSLALFEFNPENKSEIYDLRPTLSASFAASDGATIILNEVRIELDGSNITKDCSIDTIGFKCELFEDLETGEHNVEIELKDTNEFSSTVPWSFTIIEDGVIEEDIQEDDGFSFNFPEINLSILEGIDQNTIYFCCGSLLLLAIIAFIFRFLRNRKADYGGEGYSDFTSSIEKSNDLGQQVDYGEYNQDYPQSKDPLEDETYDFSIGSHDVQLGSNNYSSQNFDSVETEEFPDNSQLTQPIYEQPDFSTASPSEEASMPPWLSGDPNAGAQPVDMNGGISPGSQGIAIGEGAQVHDSFGLTPVDDNE